MVLAFYQCREEARWHAPSQSHAESMQFTARQPGTHRSVDLTRYSRPGETEERRGCCMLLTIWFEALTAPGSASCFTMVDVGLWGSQVAAKAAACRLSHGEYGLEIRDGRDQQLIRCETVAESNNHAVHNMSKSSLQLVEYATFRTMSSTRELL